MIWFIHSKGSVTQIEAPTSKDACIAFVKQTPMEDLSMILVPYHRELSRAEDGIPDDCCPMRTTQALYEARLISKAKMDELDADVMSRLEEFNG